MKWTSYCCWLVLCVWICPAQTEDELRWAHICAGSALEFRCPNGHRFTAVAFYRVYRTAGCSSELTGPVQNISDCYQENRIQLLVDNINTGCNSTQICTLDFTGGQQPIDNCRQSTLNNMYTVSYTCTFDSSITLPPTTTTTTTTTTTNATTTEATTTEATTVTTTREPVEPADYTIPLAAGGAGAAVLILLLLLVVFCVWRKRRNEDMENPQRRKLSVAEVNMSKRDSDHIKTGPRIKEEQWNRPDITLSTYHAETTYNTSDPRGLYALPDKEGKVDYINEIENRDYINAPAGEKDDKKPLKIQNYEKMERQGDLTYSNVAFSPDDDAREDSGDLTSVNVNEQINKETDATEGTVRVPSVVYAHVNKQRQTVVEEE